jgi:two-component sensor histidine kinase
MARAEADLGMRAPLPLARPRVLALAYFCLACLAAIITAFASFAVGAYDHSFKEIEQETQSTAFFLADHASRLFEASELGIREADSATKGKSWDAIERSGAIEQMLERLSSDRFPYIAAFALYDRTGRMRLSAGGDERLDPTGTISRELSAADHPFFVVPEKGFDGLFVGDPAVSSLTGRRAFVLSRRIEDTTGDFRGVVSAVADLSYFDSFYGALNLAHSPVIELFRADRHILLRYPRPGRGSRVLLSDLEGVEDAMRHGAKESVVETTDHDGPRRIYSVQKISNLPLYVSVAVPISAVVQSWWTEIQIPAVLAIVAVLAFAGLTVLAFHQARVGRRITDELERRVSERTGALKLANDQLEMLFQEVHHRVKNNLQIIASFLRLQVARTEREEQRTALQQGINRVHAMSLVHEMLYSSDEITQIDFESYLNSLAHHLNVSFGTYNRVAIVIKAEGLSFDLDTAIPLALLLNEVLSNALKHAFPNEREGRIAIDLREDRPGMALLTVTDDGVGTAPGFDWTRSKGLGLRIVRSLAAKVGGTVDFAAGDGTRFALRFRLRRADAAPVRAPRPLAAPPIEL